MSQRHLGINLSGEHAEFTVLSGALEVFKYSSSYQGKTDADRKESVRTLLSDQPELNRDFDNVTLAWCHPQSSLVPAAVFSETSPKEVFRLCFGNEATDGNIDYNRIFELSVVNVYSIPDWVKSLLVIKYPQVIMQHAGTHQVRQALQSDSFYTKATLVLHESYFRLTIVKHNKLEFYSSFDYQTAEDIIYQLNFVLQQKELLNEKGKIELGTVGTIDRSLIDATLNGLGKIQHLSKMNPVFEDAYLTKSQLLCV